MWARHIAIKVMVLSTIRIEKRQFEHLYAADVYTVMEILKSFGIIGFWFFFIKGMLWLVLFALIYYAVLDKEKANKLKEKLSFRSKAKKDSQNEDN